MDALIAELEAAPQGSRELDAKIALAVHPLLATFRDDPERGPGHWISDRDGPVYALDYTDSLDSSLSLVPEGWRAWFSWGCGFGDAGLMRPDGKKTWVRDQEMMSAPTTALALCIASLRARQAMKRAA